MSWLSFFNLFGKRNKSEIKPSQMLPRKVILVITTHGCVQVNNDHEPVEMIVPVQKCISVEKFKMIEYNKKKLEEFYDRMKNIYHDGMKNTATIVYDFLSIEGMINQTDPTKIEGSSVNDIFWDKDTLEEIRRTFNDKYIV